MVKLEIRIPKLEGNSNREIRSSKARACGCRFELAASDFELFSNFELRISNFRRRRRGFSFAEVMFAVIVLGIGFIMVAAIFPVAIQQTRMTVDESTAAAVARQAAATLEQIATNSETAASGAMRLFPESGSTIYAVRMAGFGPNNVPPRELWERLRGNLILASDPRFAWTALYKREVGSQFIQVYIFVVQQRNRSTFEQQDVQTNAPYFNLQPRRIRVTIRPATSTEPDTIAVTANGPFAAEGAFVVTADAAGAGRVFRLGVARPDLGSDIYEVDPGYDVPDSPPFNYTGNAWTVGRGFEPTSPQPNPAGPAMDVALYTTFLSVN